MPDICVIYLSEDEHIVGKLVSLLRKHWDVWWASAGDVWGSEWVGGWVAARGGGEGGERVGAR